MVSLAFLALLGSPEEVIYWTPPTMMKMTAMMPAMLITTLRMFWITPKRSLEPLQPAAFLTSAEAPELQISSAKTGVALRAVMPMRLAIARAISLMDLNFIICDLL